MSHDGVLLLTVWAAIWLPLLMHTKPTVRTPRAAPSVRPRAAPMTYESPDTPTLSRLYCPGCDLAADPTREILQAWWCHLHAPPLSGVDDADVRLEAIQSGSGEAEAENCRAAQALIR